MAYLHAVRALPKPDDLKKGPISQLGMTFEKRSHIESQLVELGWAFYCRYEGCLEGWLKDRVKLSREKPIKKWLEDNGVKIPLEFEEGLDRYRNIRNILHHYDGKNSDNTEIHLFPNMMENFYELFCWIGEMVEKHNSSNFIHNKPQSADD